MSFRPLASEQQGTLTLNGSSLTVVLYTDLDQKERKQTLALDEITEKLYRAADTGTLLALLPLLRRIRESTRDEMKHLERSQKQTANADAQISETYGEALAKFDSRFGDTPEGREAFRTLRDKVNSTLAGLHTDDQEFAQYEQALFVYITDLMERERWITDEMKRRGYLPLLPGEERYL